MTDIDRYITDEALAALDPVTNADGVIRNRWALYRHTLRRALPGILARHRADVLREAASRIGSDEGTITGAQLRDWAETWADEAVADE